MVTVILVTDYQIENHPFPRFRLTISISSYWCRLLNFFKLLALNFLNEISESLAFHAEYARYKLYHF